ncbi:Histidine triad family protein [hydrothermal vent metagenome]|uniref:Histidine triad family protein n=1 Tax=hydrothermal vent metagenome TaxID=652676 RepID=A0A3B0YYZ3_9ZZZZ
MLFGTIRLWPFERYRHKVPGNPLAVCIEQQCAAGVRALIDGEQIVHKRKDTANGLKAEGARRTKQVSNVIRESELTGNFELHPRLAADCLVVGYLPLSQLLLLNDARYPWFVLVPARAEMTEVFELDEADQQQLWRESARLARYLKDVCAADKINIGALGNLVPQLHVHHIARFTDDPAWPGPVWGHSAAVPYEQAVVQQRLYSVRDWFADELTGVPLTGETQCTDGSS